MVGERKRQLLRASALVVAVLACVLVTVVVWRAFSARPRWDTYLQALDDVSSPIALDTNTESRIVAFCGDCHAVPRAESFPRAAWHDEVEMGYQFYARSGRNDLDPPPIHLTVAYFRSRAPKQLVFPEHNEPDVELRAKFAVQKLMLDANVDVPPAVSHLRWARLNPDDAPVLLACDMRHGSVATVDLHGRGLDLLARLNNPCHVEPCDLDGDRAIDLVVADLGSFYPDDHNRGSVVWLRSLQASDSFEEVVLASGLGRVADVRPVDLDADGDSDLIVADFGMHQTGRIFLLRNVAASGERPRFEPQEIDPRPGTIHVPVHDFNRDSHPDFLALVSQEYERLEAFVNQGDAQFKVQNLWAAPDLTFASSGIELMDLDQDGDTDILYTNGDAFDNSYVNPSHGIQWLENRGFPRFAYHRLTHMLGAYRALAGDIDLDGDLDIIAVAWLPPKLRPPSVVAATLVSILCLEQTSPGRFVAHKLESGFPYHAALELGDFDNDGDLDFAAGSHIVTARIKDTRRRSHWLAVWWNQLISENQ